MLESKPWYEEIVVPALLRHARMTYGRAMRQALAAAGYDDIPRNGLYVIGGLALGGSTVPLSVLIKELGVSKQGAGQLVDTLVLRGYLERVEDAEESLVRHGPAECSAILGSFSERRLDCWPVEMSPALAGIFLAAYRRHDWVAHADR